MLEDARPLMLRPGGKQGLRAELGCLGAVQSCGQRRVDGDTERAVVGRAGQHLVAMDMAHFRHGCTQDQEQAKQSSTAHPEGQAALYEIAGIGYIAPHLLGRSYHKAPVARYAGRLPDDMPDPIPDRISNPISDARQQRLNLCMAARVSSSSGPPEDSDGAGLQKVDRERRKVRPRSACGPACGSPACGPARDSARGSTGPLAPPCTYPGLRRSLFVDSCLAARVVAGSQPEQDRPDSACNQNGPNIHGR